MAKDRGLGERGYRVRRRPEPVNKIFLVALRLRVAQAIILLKGTGEVPFFSFGEDDPGGYRKINLIIPF